MKHVIAVPASAILVAIAWFSCGQQDPSFVEKNDLMSEDAEGRETNGSGNGTIDYGRIDDDNEGGSGNVGNDGHVDNGGGNNHGDNAGNEADGGNGGNINNGGAGGNSGNVNGGDNGGNDDGGDNGGNGGNGGELPEIIVTSTPPNTFGFQLTQPDQITLNATVRDFLVEHPDFQYFVSGHTTGLVQDQIGAGRKPLLVGNHVAGTGAINNAETFSDWYRDRPFNQKINLPLVLSKKFSSDIYGYENLDFFPIDGMLHGNEGNAHNYHFTLEAHSQFVYRGGEVFEFIGDDDVWVFINNQLVVDLGGVHGQLAGQVDLDGLGLTPGQQYNFDMFFAERHLTASRFKIETTIGLIGNLYLYQIETSELGGGATTFTLEEGPAGAMVSSNGQVSWEVQETDVGATVPFKVRIAAGGSEFLHAWNVLVEE